MCRLPSGIGVGTTAVVHCRSGMVPARLELAADGGTPECFGEHTGVSAGLAGIVWPATTPADQVAQSPTSR